jgi:hypothetical protein
MTSGGDLKILEGTNWTVWLYFSPERDSATRFFTSGFSVILLLLAPVDMHRNDFDYV